jgi:hypothetical protein
MNVEIVALTQELSLRGDGETLNFLNLQLPDGTVIRALVDQETAQMVVNSHITGGAAPVQTEVHSGEELVWGGQPTLSDNQHIGMVVPAGAHGQPGGFSIGSVEDDGTMEFGGDGTGQDPDIPGMDELQARLDAASEHMAHAVPGSENMTEEQITQAVSDIRDSQKTPPQPQWRPSRKAVVRKNQMGYPIITGGDTVDPGEVVGAGDPTEDDGVSSI